LLSTLLSRADCAECKICCSFDSYDLWETPVITDQLVDIISKKSPTNIRFTEINGVRLLRLKKEPGEDLYFCSLLDAEKGCVLGDDKPFECKIWPLRIMLLENSTRVITISPVCPVMFRKPISQLYELAKSLSTEIFNHANISPEIVKPYIAGYPILIVEQKERL
jgi:hypothetical protein